MKAETVPAATEQRGYRLIRFVAMATILAVGRAQALTLEEAIATAQASDPWLQGSEYREASLQAQSVSAGTLPDPIVRVGFANLPVDTFDFNQEPMTQFQVGLSQAIPRGAMRELERSRLTALSEEQVLRREERRAQVALTVTELWLDAALASESQALIEADRNLFLQLRDVVASRYRSTSGEARQQDLVRAELELTRLDDRLAMLAEREDVARARLAEWLGAGAFDTTLAREAAEPVSRELSGDPAEVLPTHPSVRSLDARIEAGDTGVDIAGERYKPAFTVNAGYGVREDAGSGMPRPDFFSVGLAVDLPLFPANRQDQQLRAARAEAEALRTDRALLLRDLRAGLDAARARRLRLEQRQALYRERLLDEMTQQSAAALTAYGTDDGDFAEAIRAQIAELDARIEALALDVEHERMSARIAYFLAGQSTEVRP